MSRRLPETRCLTNGALEFCPGGQVIQVRPEQVSLRFVCGDRGLASVRDIHNALDQLILGESLAFLAERYDLRSYSYQALSSGQLVVTPLDIRCNIVFQAAKIFLRLCQLCLTLPDDSTPFTEVEHLPIELCADRAEIS